MGPGALSPVLRPAEPEDEAFFLDLRNDPDSIRFSRDPRPVDPADHHRWFPRALVDRGYRLWVGTVDGVPAGYVRVQVTDGVGLVSIAVAPSFRGRGLSVALLRALQDVVGDDPGVARLDAEVDPGNAPSLAAFRRAGFVEVVERGLHRFHWPDP